MVRMREEQARLLPLQEEDRAAFILRLISCFTLASLNSTSTQLPQQSSAHTLQDSHLTQAEARGLRGPLAQ